MLKTKLLAALAAIVMIAFAVPATASAALRVEPTTVRVEYKSVETTLGALQDEIGETHCHDAKGKGQLTCFATEREADLDLLGRGGLPAEVAKVTARKWGVAVPKQARSTGTADATSAAATCHPWVTVRFYDYANAGGSSVNLYCDYPDLRAVGWDNKASSMICLVCNSVITGTNQYNVKKMTAFQEYNYNYNAMTTTFNNVINALNDANNSVSSNRVYFN
ncbi:hypothetical protein [Streptomyces hydrogenans]|uniref:hypothetical protein n=1 Tax=Streptomyces hydrogenans TaxID=1873719 RepID=UPI003817D90A